MISAERLKLGARCTYLSTSVTTSLIIASTASRCGTSVERIAEREGDIVAPMTRSVCEAIERAPCQRYGIWPAWLLAVNMWAGMDGSSLLTVLLYAPIALSKPLNTFDNCHAQLDPSQRTHYPGRPRCKVCK
jgi:hypothetical protein